MSSEELQQRGYLTDAGLRGQQYGSFEELSLGATRLDALVLAGLDAQLPDEHGLVPTRYRAPKTPAALKPDNVYLQRTSGLPHAVVVCEHKPRTRFRGKQAASNQLSAMEQATLSAVALGAPIAAATNGETYLYVDVRASVDAGAIVQIEGEGRPLNPGVIQDLLERADTTPKDPTQLAEKVWQLLWHATQAEPKECLLTFVEIFVLKFLSDNLPPKYLPQDLAFYTLVGDSRRFRERTGMSEIEYYTRQIRPQIKTIFPDNTLCPDEEVASLFGLKTLVSKTSIINGFVFLRSGDTSHESYNATFKSVIAAFNDFGPLTRIDPEFKTRLYETFLRRSARQQRLGQFFTPRNIVRPIVQMAQLSQLADGSVLLDPAAGVGGFVLEPLMWDDALSNNLTIQSGAPRRRVKTVGVDVDADLHILAKANMLLHIAELVRDPASTTEALNKALAETFILMDDNKTLGALRHPPEGSVDVILTNPPYVTRGSSAFRDALKDVPGLFSEQTLSDYYGGSGLGLESLFVRYISGALRPGGRAFVIVPQGLLNRTDPGPKAQLLSECNVLASIQLPRNAFFNTAQKTYILVLEKRHTDVDPRPDVLCGLARSIGESLDSRRTPTPDDNDLSDIARAFIERDQGDPKLANDAPTIRIVGPGEFDENSRWDVLRHWSDDDLVALGEIVPPIGREAFIDDVEMSLNQTIADLADARAELASLTQAPTTRVALAGHPDATFSIGSGTRITLKQIDEHPPEDEDDRVRVFSCFKAATVYKGVVSRRWLETQQRTDREGNAVGALFPIEASRCVTVNANGASVGKVFVQPAGVLLTDDVLRVLPAEGTDIDLDYLAVALQDSVTAGGFLYEAKLFAKRLKELEIDVPVSPDGSFDVEQQRRIASAVRRFNTIVERIEEIGRTTAAARLVSDSAASDISPA